jgi:hypothetical protein
MGFERNGGENNFVPLSHVMVVGETNLLYD